MPEPAASKPRAAFDLTEEQHETLVAADDYARYPGYPLARPMDNEEWPPAEAFAKLGANGYLGVTVAQEYGFPGADLFSSGLVLQPASRWNLAFALAWVE